MKRKTKIKLSGLITLVLVSAGLLTLQSCVVYNPYYLPSVQVSDVVQMSKDGMSSKNIIKQMRKTHSVYLLKADQLAKLREEGVQDSVINYMEDTHLKAVRQNQRINDSYNMYPGGMGYGYWGPYDYWGWNIGPTFIIHGGGGRVHGMAHDHDRDGR
ncbi:MAG TPA: hypothetical protein VJ963_06545 [Bacteroidales bacterium]|nr:hypothetical protein [Bacteroidales bacterium]